MLVGIWDGSDTLIEIGLVAQLVEHLAVNQRIVGSSPAEAVEVI